MDELAAWQQHAGDPHPLTAAQRAPMDFDYSEIQRQPDRHQPPVIVEKYFRP